MTDGLLGGVPQPLQTAIGKLRDVWALTDAVMPFLMWLTGILLIADAIWQFSYLPEIAQYPRLLLFFGGVSLWLGGSISRREKKRANELERKLARVEEERDEYRELWNSEMQ